jgi:hypothetical protein
MYSLLYSGKQAIHFGPLQQANSFPYVLSTTYSTAQSRLHIAISVNT